MGEGGRRLIHTTASTNAGSGRSPEMGKFSAARRVWMPYSASAGTGFSPRGSRSMRVSGMVAGGLGVRIVESDGKSNGVPCGG